MTGTPRALLSACAAVALLALPTAPGAFEPGVTVETVVEDFEVKSVTINCPQGDGYAAFQWRMDEHPPEYDEKIERLISKIESKYGGWIRSHTTVKDGATESDRVVFKTRAGPKSRAGRQLCDYLASFQ